MPGAMEGGYFRKDNVVVKHLRGGHLDFDSGRTACTSMPVRGREHRRYGEEATAGTEGKVCRSEKGGWSRKRWWMCSCCCVASDVSPAIWDVSSWVQSTVD